MSGLDWYAPNEQCLHGWGPASDEPRDEGGGGGAAGQFTYTEAGAGRATAVGPGTVVMDGDQTFPASIAISTVDDAGHDQSDRFPRVTSGVIIRIEQVEDPAIWQEYVATGPAVMGDGYGTISEPVHWNQGGLLEPGAAVVISGRPMTVEEEQRWGTR